MHQPRWNPNGPPELTLADDNRLLQKDLWCQADVLRALSTRPSPISVHNTGARMLNSRLLALVTRNQQDKDLSVVLRDEVSKSSSSG